jgi:hypothetical protein
LLLYFSIWALISSLLLIVRVKIGDIKNGYTISILIFGIFTAMEIVFFIYLPFFLIQKYKPNNRDKGNEHEKDDPFEMNNDEYINRYKELYDYMVIEY